MRWSGSGKAAERCGRNVDAQRPRCPATPRRRRRRAGDCQPGTPAPGSRARACSLSASHSRKNRHGRPAHALRPRPCPSRRRPGRRAGRRRFPRRGPGEAVIEMGAAGPARRLPRAHARRSRPPSPASHAPAGVCVCVCARAPARSGTARLPSGRPRPAGQAAPSAGGGRALVKTPSSASFAAQQRCWQVKEKNKECQPNPEAALQRLQANRQIQLPDNEQIDMHCFLFAANQRAS